MWDVRGSLVNIREGPGTNYKVIAKVKRGDKLIKVGERGNWYQVRIEKSGEMGWIFKPLTREGWDIGISRGELIRRLKILVVTPFGIGND